MGSGPTCVENAPPVAADQNLTTPEDTAFTYTLTNLAGSDGATVSILVGTAPTATTDAFDATGNVQLDSANTGGTTSVLANDTLRHATITAFDATTANGGTVSLNTSTGTFTYTSVRGYTGADTFTYTVTNAIGSATGTVTVNVTNTIWFVDNSASVSGNGALGPPFKTIADYTDSSPSKDANDIIFLYTGVSQTTPYAGTLTLQSGQQLIGQGVALSSVITPKPGSAALPGTGTKAKLGNAGMTAVTLGANNTIRGLPVGDATSLSGTAVGNLNINTVDKNGTGGVLAVATSGALNVTLDSVTSTSAPAAAISLNNVSGAFKVNGAMAISNPAAEGFKLINSSATETFVGATISGSGAAGVSLATDTGTTSFTSLSCSPASGKRGLDVTSGGTLTISAGSVTTTNARAVSVSGTALNVALASVAVTGGGVADNGLVRSATTGTFAVNGSGATDGSGGTITATTSHGVNLTNAAGVTLKNMNVTNCGGNGVNLDNMTSPTFDNLGDHQQHDHEHGQGAVHLLQPVRRRRPQRQRGRHRQHGAESQHLQRGRRARDPGAGGWDLKPVREHQEQHRDDRARTRRGHSRPAARFREHPHPGLRRRLFDRRGGGSVPDERQQRLDSQREFVRRAALGHGERVHPIVATPHARRMHRAAICASCVGQADRDI